MAETLRTMLFNVNQINKEKLDEFLKIHKAQPVGDAYIDIIVSRDNYELFIKDLVGNGFIINYISWWEWCPEERANQYGMGGPRSRFYNGWFSELPIDMDEVDISQEASKGKMIEKIKDTIESKEIIYPNEAILFRHSEWLTPAFWLDVPVDWRNMYCAKNV